MNLIVFEEFECISKDCWAGKVITNDPDRLLNIVTTLGLTHHHVGDKVAVDGWKSGWKDFMVDKNGITYFGIGIEVYQKVIDTIRLVYDNVVYLDSSRRTTDEVFDQFSEAYHRMGGTNECSFGRKG